MLWRVPGLGRAWESSKGEGNRQAFLALLESGHISGTLALADGVPVGWCSAAPSTEFSYLRRSKILGVAIDPAVWVVSCFFVARRWRGQQVATRLLAEAERLALARGSHSMLGIPTAPAGRSPDAFTHTGVASMFLKAGYVVDRSVGARLVVKKALQVRAGAGDSTGGD